MLTRLFRELSAGPQRSVVSMGEFDGALSVRPQASWLFPAVCVSAAQTEQCVESPGGGWTPQLLGSPTTRLIPI